MNKLFIIGNGFDIAHGIPSSYSNFREYVVRTYPKAKENSDRKFEICEFEKSDHMELAAELLVYCMDLASSSDWCDFEDALSRINFADKFPIRSEEEKRTDYQMDLMIYFGKISVITEIFSELIKLWQIIFSDWVKSLQNFIDQKDILMKDNIKEIIESDNNIFITFNYTKTLQSIYNVKVVKHIHNRVGQTLVFGHGLDDVFYSEKSDGSDFVGSSDLDDLILSLRKDTKKQIKKYQKFLNSITNEITKVYSYGFSYSDVDLAYIEEIVKRISTNANWYFTRYEFSNQTEINLKKKKLRNIGFTGEFHEY